MRKFFRWRYTNSLCKKFKLPPCSICCWCSSKQDYWRV